MPKAKSTSYRRIYTVARRVPKGRVATYGQIAALSGLGGHARQVGYAMHALPDDSGVPWHRIINARGEVSKRGERGWEQVQRALLEGEGVRFDTAGRVSLQRFQWRPRGPIRRTVPPPNASPSR